MTVARAVSLSSAAIVHAVHTSPDRGHTLDLSHHNLADIPDDVASELAELRFSSGRSRPGDPAAVEDDLCVSRIALSYNRLATLPITFNGLKRLRYLNLRSNLLNDIPYVLTTMPSLEILDLSRNSIKSFPDEPGNLGSLQILSISRNRITRLPAYLATFHRLNILKLDHNPIQWPPAHVWASSQDLEEKEAMSSWLSNLKAWLANADEGVSSRNFAESSFQSISGSSSSSPPFSFPGFNHARTYSSDSNASSQGDSLDFMASSPTWRNNADLRPEFPSVSRLDDLSLSLDEEGLDPGPQHTRTLSHSVHQGSPKRASLSNKKSLPDLRTIRRTDTSESLSSTNSHYSPAQATPKNISGSLFLPSTPSPNPVGQLLNRLRSNSPFESEPPSDMAVERNAYFKRLSTQQLAAPSSTATPAFLLSVVDAIRGIYFAIHQVYEQVEHYTVWTFDERISGILRKVLDPARVYKSQLIHHLDRFDAAAVSNQGSQLTPLIKGLMESCRDNVSICSKVIAALQLQLKVLAGVDDVRFTRSLVLMLYGSIGEISNSWRAIVPQAKKVKSIIQAGRSTAPRANLNSEGSPDVIKKRQAGGRPFRNASVRRHAGSFSVEDVELGRSMHEVSPISDSMPTAEQAQTSQEYFPEIEPSHKSTRSISLEDSPPSLPKNKPLPPLANQNGPGDSSRLAPVPPPSAFRQATKKSQHHLELPTNDSSRFVDGDLLVTLTSTVDDAHILWLMVEDVLGHLDEPGTGLRDALDVAVKITVILSGTIAAIKNNPAGLGFNDKSLFEDALQFIKAVAKVSLELKTFGSSRPLPSALRGTAAKLAQSTKELAVLLHVSSYSPSAASTPTPYSSEDSPQIPTSNLSRSRSAQPTSSTKFLQPQNRDIPRSALPDQRFNLPIGPTKGQSGPRSANPLLES